jgi:hypothetical protein
MAGGTASGKDCGGWGLVSSQLDGTIGEVGLAQSGWTAATKQTCDKKARLYCFEK